MRYSAPMQPKKHRTTEWRRRTGKVRPRRNRKRLTVAQAEPILAELSDGADASEVLKRHFPDTTPVLPRTFDIALELYAAFRRIMAPRIAEGSATESDCINEALAQWCAKQEQNVTET